MNQPQEVPLRVQLSQMITAKMVAKPIYAVAKLGIPDLVKDQPKTADELARATGSHAPSLYRILRALASVGIFSERSDGKFETTPMAQMLETGPQGLRGMAMMFGGGLDVGRKQFSVRLFQLDWLSTRFNGFTDNNNVRFSTGVLVHF